MSADRPACGHRLTAGEASRPRFEDLTETTDIPVSVEGADMMYTRYHLASRLSAGKRVLEVGCGAGQGLGLLRCDASRLVGGDSSLPLLRSARAHYRGQVALVCFSAERLPFPDTSFDVLLSLETSYYVPRVDAALGEMVRVLAPGGILMFVNANPERPDFIKSPHSTRYHTADAFRASLGALGLAVEVAGAFPVAPLTQGTRSRVLGAAAALARRVLEELHLVPRTLRGRARLKRLIYGKLKTVPPELNEGFGKEAALTPVPPGPVTGYKVLYVTATRPR